MSYSPSSPHIASTFAFTCGDIAIARVVWTLTIRKSDGAELKIVEPGLDVFRKELNKIPDFKVFVQDLSTRGFTAQRGFPVEFTVRGPDWEKLAQVSQTLVGKMFISTDWNASTLRS